MGGARASMPEIERRALSDARALERGGVDAILVENFGDRPFSAGPAGPETIACMAAIVRTVRESVRLPLGVNVLRNDGRAAVAVARAAGASFVRINVLCGLYAAPEGLLAGHAREIHMFRNALGGDVKLFADILVKHARPLSGDMDPGSAAREVLQRGRPDVVIVTGPETARAPARDLVETFRAAVGKTPLYLGSGLTHDNLEVYMPYVDGAIVGTEFKAGGNTENPVDPTRVRRLVRAVRRLAS